MADYDVTSLSRLYRHLSGYEADRNLDTVATDSCRQIQKEPLHVLVLGSQQGEKLPLIQSLCHALASPSNRSTEPGNRNKGDSIQQSSEEEEADSVTLLDPECKIHGSSDNIRWGYGRKMPVRKTLSLPSFLRDPEQCDPGRVSMDTESYVSEDVSEDEGLVLDLSTEDPDLETVVVDTAAGELRCYWQPVCDVSVCLWEMTTGDPRVTDGALPTIQHNFDVVVILTRYLAGMGGDVLNTTSKQRNVLVVHPFASPLTTTTYRSLRTQYRQRLFKLGLSDVPLFVLQPVRADKFDFPDLLKHIEKLGKVAAKGRKQKLGQTLKDCVESRYSTEQARQSGLPWLAVRALCALCVAEPFMPLPVLPLVGDVLLYRYWYYYGNRASRTTVVAGKETLPLYQLLSNRRPASPIGQESQAVTPPSSTPLSMILAPTLAPCCSVWLAARFAGWGLGAVSEPWSPCASPAVTVGWAVLAAGLGWGVVSVTQKLRLDRWRQSAIVTVTTVTGVDP